MTERRGRSFQEQEANLPGRKSLEEFVAGEPVGSLKFQVVSDMAKHMFAEAEVRCMLVDGKNATDIRVARAIAEEAAINETTRKRRYGVDGSSYVRIEREFLSTVLPMYETEDAGDRFRGGAYVPSSGNELNDNTRRVYSKNVRVGLSILSDLYQIGPERESFR